MLIDQDDKTYTTTIHYPDNSNYASIPKQEIAPNFNN